MPIENSKSVLALLALVVFVIQKHEFAKARKVGIERFSVVRLGELIHELHEVRVTGNHESGDGDVHLAAFCR